MRCQDRRARIAPLEEPTPQAATLQCHWVWVWVCVTFSVAFLGVQAMRSRLVPSSSFPQS